MHRFMMENDKLFCYTCRDVVPGDPRLSAISLDLPREQGIRQSDVHPNQEPVEYEEQWSECRGRPRGLG